MAVLLLAEVVQGRLNRDATAKAVTAVRGLGEITVLCVGRAVGDAARQLACIAGVARVRVADHEVYAHDLAEPVAALVAGLAPGHAHVVAASTSQGKNVMPRVAALLDVMVLSDVCAVIDGETFERPIYAGNAIQTVRSGDACKVMTIRTASFQAAGDAEAVSIAPVTAVPVASSSRWVSDALTARDRPELASARRVVSGGRGLGSKENFALIERLADRIDAAVGASRAAVDAGFAANDLQVGQTGQVVAPDLYVAVGISGAIQHLAGMKDSRLIVAINKDEEAPIFQIADIGLVDDLFHAVPELIAKV